MLDILRGFRDGSVAKNLSANRGDVYLIPGLGRPLEEADDNAFQHSCLENPG